ncbi:MAG: hypothetical protein ACRDS0_31000 [Pseudonocardiaceae bacterium]
MSVEFGIGEQLGGVGATSLGVARLRAEESLRPDRLVEDPYACYIMEAAAGSGWATMTPQAGPELVRLAG